MAPDKATDKDLEDVLNDATPQVMPEKNPARVEAAKKAAAARKLNAEIAAKEAAKAPTTPEMHEDPVVDEKLAGTANRKKGWIKIVIDEVEGLANYEVVGLNGKVYQIKRGTPTLVPPGVVGVLENCVATKTIQSRDPATGAVMSTYHDYCPIPWRTVR